MQADIEQTMHIQFFVKRIDWASAKDIYLESSWPSLDPCMFVIDSF